MGNHSNLTEGDSLMTEQERRHQWEFDGYCEWMKKCKGYDLTDDDRQFIREILDKEKEADHLQLGRAT